MRKIVILLSSISFALLLLLLIVLCLLDASRTQQRDTALLNAVQTASTHLHLNILLVQTSQVQHYDAITLAQNSLFKRINALPDREKQVLLLSWQTLNQGVEQFKTAQALYKNSVLYFSATSLGFILDTKQDNAFITLLIPLHKQLHQHPQHITLNTIHLNQQIEQLKQYAASVSAANRQGVKILTQHADMLLKNLTLIEEVNASLLNTDISTQALHMQQTRYKETQSHRQWLIYAAWVVSVLLFLLVLNIIHAVIKSKPGQASVD